MASAKKSRKLFALLLSAIMVLSLAACAGNTETTPSDGDNSAPSSEQPSNESFKPQETENDLPESSEAPGDTASEETDGITPSDSKILVAYFSHTGENYNVGVIENGNTHIIADMIAEETGADLFEIATVNPYPDTYDECTDVAKQEQNDNARPEIIDPPENLDQYDTIFIGYPIWWGDLPMAVYTFLEGYDFSGKTVIPFNTHEGSGQANTKSSIEGACPGATVLDGLAIRGSVAQNEQDEAKADVIEWLERLEFEHN